MINAEVIQLIILRFLLSYIFVVARSSEISWTQY